MSQEDFECRQRPTAAFSALQFPSRTTPPETENVFPAALNDPQYLQLEGHAVVQKV